MTKLDFALWDSVSTRPQEGQVMADVYADHIRLAQRVEELGWHSYFVIEHQNSPVGRITSPGLLSARADERGGPGNSQDGLDSRRGDVQRSVFSL